MSSILDALRKLEEERAAANDPPDIDVDDAMAERDLIGGGRSGGGLRVTPVALLLGAAGLVALLALSSAVAVMVAMRASQPQLATLPSAATSSVAVALTEAAPAPAITPAPETVVISEPATPTTVVVPMPTERGTPAPAAPPRVELDAARPAAIPPSPSRPEPVNIAQLESIPLDHRIPLSEDEPSGMDGAEEVMETKTKQEYAADPSLWPRLSTALKIRLVGDKKLQMARPLARPRASAVVDMDSVYLNDVIPGTNARIVEVNGRGIGIEIVGSGERFYWPMGV